MKRITLLTLILLFSVSVDLHAQDPSEFDREGFIVMMESGDTIHGKLKRRNAEWADHADVWFMFEDGRMEKIDKKTISAYKIDHSLFVYKELSPIQKRLLLVLETGTVTLYEQHLGMSASNYWLMKDGQKNMYPLPEESTNGKIKKYFKDDPVIVEKLKKKEYNMSSIRRVVREYNERHPSSGSGIH